MNIKSVLRYYLLAVMLFLMSNDELYAYSEMTRLQVAEVVDSYYSNLQLYAEKSGKKASLEARDKLRNIFISPNSVVNDLNPYNSELPIIEDDLENYLAVILNLSLKFNYKIDFSYEIDEKSIVNIKDIIDEQITSAEKNEPLCWVTVKKKVAFADHPENNFVRRETFKLKGQRIERICSPEQSSAIVDGITFYLQKDYLKAYESFLRQIECDMENEDTYWYLGLLFRKHKVPNFSSNVSDKLCIFYWNKCVRGRSALKQLGVDQVNTHSLKQKYPFNNGVMVVYKGSKYGFMHQDGKMAIPYTYSDAWDFSDGLALVRTSRGYGYINPAGREVIVCQYSSASSFEGGYAVVEKNGLRGAINKSGDVVVPFRYKFLKYYPSEGYFLTSIDRVNYIEYYINKAL